MFLVQWELTTPENILLTTDQQATAGHHAFVGVQHMTAIACSVQGSSSQLWTAALNGPEHVRVRLWKQMLVEKA